MPSPRLCSLLLRRRDSVRNFALISLQSSCGSYSTATSRTSIDGTTSLSQEGARRLVSVLSEKERLYLSQALSDTTSFPEDEKVQRPTNRQLQLVLTKAALPFVGFGFLDNAVMIIAGEYIDITIGVALGISTMAAAALGNLISDLCGLGLADSVEALCRRLGLPNPKLTTPQLRHNSVRWMQRIGRVIGITIGCLLGMCPLYWFDQQSHTADTGSSKGEHSNNTTV